MLYAVPNTRTSEQHVHAAHTHTRTPASRYWEARAHHTHTALTERGLWSVVGIDDGRGTFSGGMLTNTVSESICVYINICFTSILCCAVDYHVGEPSRWAPCDGIVWFKLPKMSGFLD